MKMVRVPLGLIYTTRDPPRTGVDYNLLPYLLICSEQSPFILGESCAPAPELSSVVQSVRWAQQTRPDIPALTQQLTQTWASLVLGSACLC
jgi:hypothetical protein